MTLHRPLARQHGNRGFTLVELMVALTIGMFLMIGLVSLLVSTTSSRTELDKSTRQIENGRYALQLLTQDIQLAGFTGEMSTTALTPQAPVSCPAAVTDLQYTPSTSPTGSVVPMPVYALTTAPSCATNWVSKTAMLIVSRAETDPISLASAGANTNETYLQVSTCANDGLPFAVSTGTVAAAAATAASAGNTVTTFNLMQKDCQTTNPAQVRKLIQRLYYISSCNVCTGNTTDTTPTLKMVEFVGGKTQVTPLVEGIENLQFDYGIDMDGDGSPDCYVSDPSNTSANPAQIDPSVCPQPATPYVWTVAATNWKNVMAVRVHLLARSNDTSAGWTDTRTYDLGLANPAFTTGDHYKRHAYSTVVRLYNGSGQRETP